MKIYVARHGRSNYNDLELFNSDPSVDVYLTDLGIKQAKTLAKNLEDTLIQTIFTSELKRTKQTGDIVNEYHNAPIVADARLNDHRSGFDNMSYAEYDTLYDSTSEPWNARFNNGESLEDTRLRVQSFLDDLRTKDYESVLIVTSMTIVQAFYGILNNLSSEETWSISVETGTYTEFSI
jgi:broad specificity phosphatase PhoE